MRTLDDIIAAMPVDRQERVAARTRELTAEEHARQARRQRRRAARRRKPAA